MLLKVKKQYSKPAAEKTNSPLVVINIQIQRLKFFWQALFFYVKKMSSRYIKAMPKVGYNYLSSYYGW